MVSWYYHVCNVVAQLLKISCLFFETNVSVGQGKLKWQE